MLTHGPHRCLVASQCSPSLRPCKSAQLTRGPAAARTTQLRATTDRKVDKQLELEACIAAKSEQLRALENKVQALEALQERQLKAAAALKQLRMTEAKAKTAQLEEQEQWIQQSWAYKDVSSGGHSWTAAAQLPGGMPSVRQRNASSSKS